MGLISKLLKLGVAAGAAYTAVKVSDKYKEQNPEGVSDPEQKLDAIKKAASDVFSEAKDMASDKAPEVVSKVQEAATNISGKAKEFVDVLTAEDADFEPAKDEKEVKKTAAKKTSESKTAAKKAVPKKTSERKAAETKKSEK